ncbi:hypothetical protein RBB50_008844 [Rhinocladiella similis]
MFTSDRMRRFWSLVSLSVTVAHAEDLRWDARTPLKFMPKGAVAYTNSTISYLNTTSAAAATTSPTESPSFSTSSDDTITHPITSTPHTNIGIYTNTSSIVPETTNTTDDTPSCTGSVTYYGSVPPTVYVTVTEGFDVTVTASNISVTDTPTLITPLPYCQQTIMPEAGLPVPGASFVSAPLVAPSASAASKSAGNLPFASKTPPGPAPPQETHTATMAASSAYSSVPYTSTVIVTKKTPVTIIAPPTSSPDINFDPPPPSSGPPSEPSSVNAHAGGGNSDGNPGNHGNDGGPNHNGNDGSPLSPGGAGTSPVTTNTMPPFPSLTNTAGPAPGTLVVPSTTPPGIGNIIASIIYSPFATRAPTGRPAFSPVTTTIDNIPIVVSASRVIIGTQTVDIPRSSSTVVQAGGNAFTVRPSIIVAPTATITLAPAQQNNAATVPPATTTFTTAIGGLTITVGPTVAIISGTTYRIGENAPATTISVHGTKISIGSEGIGLPSTTIFPGGSPFVVVSAEGWTFSLDESQAVFSGTTYRIGSNAPQVTTTVASDSISFGPGGIGLKSTTILPTAAPHSTQQTSEPSITSASGASASESTSTESAASSRSKPLDIIFNWHAWAIFLCLFV